MNPEDLERYRQTSATQHSAATIAPVMSHSLPFGIPERLSGSCIAVTCNIAGITAIEMPFHPTLAGNVPHSGKSIGNGGNFQVTVNTETKPI